MGVIRKIVLSLLLAATLAHGQLSIDLYEGDITAPLQHQGKIEQQYSPENIERTYGDAPGQHLAPLDETIETIYGGKYLFFESSHSVKMRGFNFLSLHAF